MSDYMAAVRSPPRSEPENSQAFLPSAIARSFCPCRAGSGSPLVHYPWHPYFRRKVLVRRVEQRATGQFVLVEGPTSIVVSIARLDV
jgi:hypothetical protein